MGLEIRSTPLILFDPEEEQKYPGYGGKLSQAFSLNGRVFAGALYALECLHKQRVSLSLHLPLGVAYISAQVSRVRPRLG